MNIQIQKLQLTNFKGIRSFMVENIGPLVNIYGCNGSGKTTLYDAFLYLLFGKNSEDKSDFNVRPLDANNKPVHKIDCEVMSILDVDGIHITLKKVFREKWTKKKGEETAELTGNETLYFYNEVPMSQGEYKIKIDAIVNEAIFKLITSPTYFNTAIKWSDRRRILTNLAGEISNQSILDKVITPDNKHYYDTLINLLNQKASIEEYRKKIGADKKRLKDEIDQIPTRIDEIVRSTPATLDFKAIASKIAELQNTIARIDQEIADSSTAYNRLNAENLAKINKVNELKLSLTRIEGEANMQAQKAIQTREGNIREYSTKIKQAESDIAYNNTFNRADIEKKNKSQDDVVKLRQAWNTENDRQIGEFDFLSFVCPTCKRPLETDDIEAKKAEMVVSFNSDKLANLNNIRLQGTEENKAIEILTKNIAQRDAKIKELETERDNYRTMLEELQKVELVFTKPDYTAIPEYVQIQKQISDIQDTIVPITPVDNTALSHRKIPISMELDNLKRQFNSQDQIATANNRIAELNDQNKKLSQELASLEKTEFAIMNFEKAKIEMVESRINSKFRLARFKMFEKLINGGTEETCVTTVNGVPYSDLNNGMRIAIGVEIIGVLSAFYDCHAPVFVDNREGVSVIPEIASQIINLYVSPDDKYLTIR